TVEDVARFVTAVHSGELLSAEALRLSRTPHTKVPVPAWGDPFITDVSYGYGVHIGTFDGHTVYFHPGDVPGYLSFSAWLPDVETGVVVLLNESTNDIRGLVERLLREALS